MKNIYLHYDAVQLATDEDFIRWVKHPAPGEEAAWQDWLNENPEKRPEVEAARSLVNAIKFRVDKPDVDTGQLWERIKVTKEEPAVVQSLRGRRRFLFGIAGAVAAAVALLLFIIGLGPENTINTGIDEHRAYILPDRSRVQLNAVTQLSHDESGRRVELEGEAFFAVEKGSTFVVATPRGTVEVLGTQFNVFSRERDFRVKCTEGRVRVTVTTDENAVILTPGMICELDENGKLQVENLSGPEAEVAWLEDTYRFDNQSLRSVFAELERQFDVEVATSDSILSLPYTGFFDGANLDTALYNICYARHLNYTIEGKQIKVTEAATE